MIKQARNTETTAVAVDKTEGNSPGEKLQTLAARCVGWKYSPRGRDYEGGNVDCFGIFLLFASEMGFAIPDYEYEEDWYKNGKERIIDGYPKYAEKIKRKDLEPGNVILFRMSLDVVNHIGVYLGEGKFITCTQGAGVVILDLNRAIYGRRFHSAYRLKQAQ